VAAVVLFLTAAELSLATPGLDRLGDHKFEKPKARAAMMEQTLGFLAVYGADFNRAVRLPVNRRLGTLQRPLRIAQSWSLYGGGPEEVQRLEVLVDGQLLFRSKDPERDWLEPVLTYRRVRPIVATTCGGSSLNDDNLVAYIIRRARADYPAAQQVVVRCTAAPFPDLKLPVESQRYEATAPSWEVTR